MIVVHGQVEDGTGGHACTTVLAAKSGPARYETAIPELVVTVYLQNGSKIYEAPAKHA